MGAAVVRREGGDVAAVVVVVAKVAVAAKVAVVAEVAVAAVVAVVVAAVMRREQDETL